MSYKEQERRLKQLEQAAASAARSRFVGWLRGLSDADLDRLCQDIEPETQAQMERMTDTDLEQAIAAGDMSAWEWEASLQDAQARLGGAR